MDEKKVLERFYVFPSLLMAKTNKGRQFYCGLRLKDAKRRNGEGER
jgi:hypothetical protein